MFVIAGLGNPGPRYETTRHNIGFLLIDELARDASISLKTQSRFQAVMGEGILFGEKVLLVKPLSFMNLCGDPIGNVCRYFQIEAKHLVTISDDLDQLPGQVRMRQGGGHGGHNGLRDLIAKFGPDFFRIKVGIGKPAEEFGGETTSWVLGSLSDAELIQLQEPQGKVFQEVCSRLENIFMQSRKA